MSTESDQAQSPLRTRVVLAGFGHEDETVAAGPARPGGRVGLTRLELSIAVPIVEQHDVTEPAVNRSRPGRQDDAHRGTLDRSFTIREDVFERPNYPLRRDRSQGDRRPMGEEIDDSKSIAWDEHRTRTIRRDRLAVQRH